MRLICRNFSAGRSFFRVMESWICPAVWKTAETIKPLPLNENRLGGNKLCRFWSYLSLQWGCLWMPLLLPSVKGFLFPGWRQNIVFWQAYISAHFRAWCLCLGIFWAYSFRTPLLRWTTGWHLFFWGLSASTWLRSREARRKKEIHPLMYVLCWFWR